MEQCLYSCLNTDNQITDWRRYSCAMNLSYKLTFNTEKKVCVKPLVGSF